MTSKRQSLNALVLTLAGLAASNAQAGLITVSGPLSSAGSAASIIATPADVLDDFVMNTGMQGFDEARGVITTVAHAMDDGATVAIGSRVDSHMIFLNSDGQTRLNHFGVEWVFDGLILGVMSDRRGELEAASSFELGAPGTNYTVRSPGSGPAAPFNARGIEGNNGVIGPHPYDGYVINGNRLTVGMSVTEPGDWIRVITATSVPAPTSFALFGLGLLGLWRMRRPR